MRHSPPLFCRLLVLGLLLPVWAQGLDLPKEMGKETAECVKCHREHTPGVVYDWARSRHAWTRPEASFEKPAATRRFSALQAPEAFKGRVVGCFECHGQNPDLHPETFDHRGYRIHVLVTPQDCQACHPVEVGEFARSRKATSFESLARSPFAGPIADVFVGRSTWTGGSLEKERASEEAVRQECWGCHGAPLSVSAKEGSKTAPGASEFTTIANWPNQGIGRLNPDGTRGACGACHGRHSFAVEDARHSETCARCHTGGHSPASDAYSASSHGGLYRAREPEFDWGNVPWVVGQDFPVPTCAACHASQLVNGRGAVIARRSHDFGSRIWVRLLSPPEVDGAVEPPLPAQAGVPASDGTPSAADQAGRRAVMTAVCTSCHGGPSSQAYLAALDAVVRDADAGAQAATALVREGWQRGLAGRGRLFDDPLEALWLEVWFLDSTAARYGVAMGGPPGLGTPVGGRAQMNRALRDMERELAARREAKGQ